MSDDSATGNLGSPTRLGGSSSPPAFSVSCDNGVSDTRLASSGRCNIDPSRSAAIERFLLGAQTTTAPPLGGGLATSVASTSAPGGDYIRGPQSAVDNVSFVSVKHPESADAPLSEPKPAASPKNTFTVAKSSGTVVGRSSRLGEKSLEPSAGAEAKIKSPKEIPPEAEPRGRTPPSRGRVKLVLDTPVQLRSPVSERSPTPPVEVRSALAQPRTTTLTKCSSVGRPAAVFYGSPDGTRKCGIKRTKSLGDLSQALLRGDRAADVSEWLAECSSHRRADRSAASVAGSGVYQRGSGFSEFVSLGPVTARSDRGGKSGVRTQLRAVDRVRRGEDLSRADAHFDPSPGLGRGGRHEWQRGGFARGRFAEDRAYGHVGPGSPGLQSHASAPQLPYFGGMRGAERDMDTSIGGRSLGAPSVHGAMSDQFVGQHIRVRATSVTRAARPESPTTAFTPGTQGSGFASPGVGGKGSQPSPSHVAASNLGQAHPPVGQATHAERMFMSLIADRSRERRQHFQRTPSTFSLPVNCSTDVSPVRDLSSPGSFQSPSVCHGASGGGVGGGGKGGDGSGGGGGKGGGGGGDRGGNKKGGRAGKVASSAGDEEENEERQYKERSCTALHSIPWDQRAFLPVGGFGMKRFSIFSAPLFWEKLDWTVRASLFTVLPLMILTLEPKTEHIFPMPSSVAFLAFWISMPTFGSGLREFIIALKGYALSLLLLLFVVLVDPQSTWLILLLLFIFVLSTAFFAEELKKTCAYCLTVFLMERQAKPAETGIEFVKDYFITLLIALAFGLAAFFIPSIRWSSDLAKAKVSFLGNSLSIFVQGTCSSFWTRSPLERELHILRLRQLQFTAKKAADKAREFLEEADYEPHTGHQMEGIKQRLDFFTNMHGILSSMVQVVELVNDDPGRIETPVCISFGEAIEEDLAIISSAMDSTILKISDFKNGVNEEDIHLFCEARERFQDRLAEVRQQVILNNEMYETGESDVLLGFFMFSVDELCEVISSFNPSIEAKSRFLSLSREFLSSFKSPYEALRRLVMTIIHRRTITRRAKEAIKLALCMTLPSIFQVYALDNNATSPVAGAAIIAFVYSSTGAQSFTYAVNRVLGTVLGSLCALIAVQVADGRRLVLYVAVAIISFLGAYVQTSKEYYAAGNAICNSVISVITQYKNSEAAMVRIQQNLFAIIIYFCITMVLWPMRARNKVYMSFDISLRCFREATCRLLRNLDMPEDVNEVDATTTEALAQWNKKISRQAFFLPGAATEPTLVGASFPEPAWSRLIDVQWKLWAIVSMMRFAYVTFMASKVDDETELSVHWVVLRRISPFAKDMCDLLYATVDLCLLILNKTAIVPSAHLTRLRHGMLDAEHSIVETYIQTLAHKIAGDGGSANNSCSDMGSGPGGGSDGVSSHLDMHSPRGVSHPDSGVAQRRRKPRVTDGYFVYNVTEEEEELMRTFRNRTCNARQLTQTCDNDSHGGRSDNGSDGDGGRKPGHRKGSDSSRDVRTPDKDDGNGSGNKSFEKAEDIEEITHEHGEKGGVRRALRQLLRRRTTGRPSDAETDRRKEASSNAPAVAACHSQTDEAADVHNSDDDVEPLVKGPRRDRKKEGGERLYSESEVTLVHSQSDNSQVETREYTMEKSSKAGKQLEKQSKNETLRPSAATAASPAPAADICTRSEDGSSSHSVGGDGVFPACSFFDAKEKELVLSNRDIHSLEAFLFGVRALTVQLGDLQKALLEMVHSNELEKTM
ncbi:Fusaric acid resistance protein-like, putative [Trypanosoma equiperdum]|uniref:Fusaric acid resistance protein-like, putative n=1 Tax=Trypanosoma equiperdum TaxID=5694 RepID=A0A1G4HYS0_TRYEQ|nr:Fusaric acid resistance protein-like, putative [Trypanosoma equiperdum]